MSIIKRGTFTLLKDYASLTPARFIQLPPQIPFTELNSCLVDLILLNPHFQTYPPSKQYQRYYWKTIIAQLESLLVDEAEEVEEIDPRILDHYLSILASSGPSLFGSSSADMRDKICDRGLPLAEAPSKSFVTHFWESYPNRNGHLHYETADLANYQFATLEESRTTIESGTTGLRTWLASHILASYLIQNPGIVQGKNILELGSGIGFLGIIVASLQQLASKNNVVAPSCIWMTDVNEEVLAQCRRNVQLPCNLSSTHEAINFQVLDWEDALKPNVAKLEDLLQDQINPDVILGADIVFDPTLVIPLVALIALALRPSSNGKRRSAVMALMIRISETFQLFLEHAREKGLLLEDVILPQPSEESYLFDTVEVGASANNVRVLRITLGQNKQYSGNY